MAGDFVPSFYPCMMDPSRWLRSSIPGLTLGSRVIACGVAVIAAMSDQRDGVLAWLPFRMPLTDAPMASRCTIL